jgi:NAD(P)-dependent dehydrogenase (short-subunit alcohol dehydrogenase family)
MSSFPKNAGAQDVSEGVDLAERHAVVTGANTGIGFETARVLALRGAKVTLACRNAAKAADAKERIVSSAAGLIAAEQLEFRELDLASLASVREFAAGYLESGRPLHVLVNNAGVMLPGFRRTSDGFDAQFGINHLGHFLLTNLLGPALEKSAPARVVVVASDALAAASLTDRFEDLNWEKRKYSGLRAYGDSKLMNVMFATEFDHRFRGKAVVANALHPGIIATELGRDQPWYMKIAGLLMIPMMKDVSRGASTSVLLATSPEYAERGGCYLADNAEKALPKLAQDDAARARLWEISAELTGLQ